MDELPPFDIPEDDNELTFEEFVKADEEVNPEMHFEEFVNADQAANPEMHFDEADTESEVIYAGLPVQQESKEDDE